METEETTYKGQKMMIALAYLCMIMFGLMETIRGVVIPSIKTEFLVDYTHIGQMFFVFSLGNLAATFFCGITLKKYGFKKIFTFGISMIIISTLLFSVVPNFYGVMIIFALLGIGLGCFKGVNALGAKIFVKNAAMMMNLLHLFFGVGAIIGPRYAGLFIENDYSWKTIYLTITILAIILLIIILLSNFPQASADEVEGILSFKELIKDPKVWIIATLLGFLVAMELGISGWLVNYLQVERSLNVASSTSYLTWFYITFTLGRLIGGIVMDKMGYIKGLLYFGGIAIILLVSGLMLGDQFLFLFSIIGFFVSIFFPTMMVLIMKEYPYEVGTVMGFAITISGLLNMIANWVIGIINDLLGVTAGMVSFGVYGVVGCGLLFVLKALNREESQP